MKPGPCICPEDSDLSAHGNRKPKVLGGLSGLRRAFVEKYPKPIRFLFCSICATGCDFVLYLACVQFLSPSISQAISYFFGIVVNFILQKIFVFDNQVRRTSRVFLLSVPFAILGLLMSSLFIHHLTKIVFFTNYQIITKLIITGLIFFYNYFTRKLLFEGSFSRFAGEVDSASTLSKD
jgi:putative flippase GtrA